MTSRLVGAACLAIAVAVVPGRSQTRDRAPHNAAEFDALFQQVKNWGRWGNGRSARLGQPGHRGQAQAGGRARQGRHHRVARAQRADREGRGQLEPLRAHDAARQQHGPLRRLVSRLRAQPHRRALPHPLQGSDLQRLRTRRRQHRKGLHQARHRQPEERHRHARHPHRHPATQKPAVPRTGHGDLRRGSRSVGEEGGREDCLRRRDAVAHRTLGAPREAGAVECRPERRRSARLGGAVDQGARRGVPRQRRAPRT